VRGFVTIFSNHRQNAESATFVWWGGQANLPIGFRYQVDQGADRFEGHFTSADGKVVIRHDIGGYAGAWASRDKSLFFREDLIDGARVWIAKRDWPDGRAKGWSYHACCRYFSRLWLRQFLPGILQA
jgi:hypothetical protein